MDTEQKNSPLGEKFCPSLCLGLPSLSGMIRHVTVKLSVIPGNACIPPTFTMHLSCAGLGRRHQGNRDGIVSSPCISGTHSNNEINIIQSKQTGATASFQDCVIQVMRYCKGPVTKTQRKAIKSILIDTGGRGESIILLSVLCKRSLNHI